MDNLRPLTTTTDASAQRAESAIGADFVARRPANPITLCDGHGADFMTGAGQILWPSARRPPGTTAAGSGQLMRRWCAQAGVAGHLRPRLPCRIRPFLTRPREADLELCSPRSRVLRFAFHFQRVAALRPAGPPADETVLEAALATVTTPSGHPGIPIAPAALADALGWSLKCLFRPVGGVGQAGRWRW